MDELQFEWDEDKAAQNVAKHGVSFLTAAETFANEMIERIDDREDYGELRFITLGRVDTEICRVDTHGAARRSFGSSRRRKRAEMSEKPTTVRYSLSEIKAKRARGEDRTRADAPEAESLGEEFWKQARVVMPRGKTSLHLRLDSDNVDWFKTHGKGHLTRMNAVLRAYVDAHRNTP